MALCHNPNFFGVGLGVGIFPRSDLQTDCLNIECYVQYKHLVPKIITEMAADAHCRLVNHQSILY